MSKTTKVVTLSNVPDMLKKSSYHKPLFIRGMIQEHPAYGIIPILIDDHGDGWISGATLKEIYGYNTAKGMAKSTSKFVAEENTAYVRFSELLELFDGVAEVKVAHGGTYDKSSIGRCEGGAKIQLNFNPNVNTFFNENGLYELAIHSTKPSAEKFRKWIANEVLPTIRKQGMYTHNLAYIQNHIGWDNIDPVDKKKFEQVKEYLAEVTEELIQKQRLREAREKADYLEDFVTVPGTCPVRIIASAYGVSSQNFNHTLEKMGIQYNRGGLWFLTVKYADKGWAKIAKKPFFDKNHNYAGYYAQLRWTQEGAYGIYNILKQAKILPKKGNADTILTRVQEYCESHINDDEADIDINDDGVREFSDK